MGATSHRWAGRTSAGPLSILAVLAAMGMSGCGGGESTPDHTMRVDTISGVVHVQHGGRAPVATLSPGVTVGETGGFGEPSPAEFGRVRSVMADADGRFYVADAHALEIRVFEPDGRFVRALGRKGGGPAEIEGLHGTAWLTPDTMLVMDYGNARLTLLDREGRHLGQWPWMRVTGNVRFYYPVRDGEVYAHGIRTTGESDAERQRVEPVWVRYGPAGAIDSLPIPQPAGPIPGTGVICRGEALGFFSNPHGDRLLTAPAPGGERVVGLSSSYRLAFLNPAGDTVRILTRDAEPVPVPDEEWRETADQYAEFQQNWRGASCEGEIRRPRYRPTLRDITFDHHGRLLVELNTPGGPVLDVFDTDYRWLATLPLPERDTGVPIFLRDQRLYLVARDSLDVQRVEVYSVERLRTPRRL
jgi:hypothetical protein